MYQRSFCIGDIRCHLRLRQSPCCEGDSKLWFGFPVLSQEDAELDSTVSSDSRMRGYFLRVVFTPETLQLTTDLCGGFRLYWVRVENEYWYSDDYRYLISILSQTSGLELDTSEIEYWRRHRYTTGDRTYISGLNKVSPGVTIVHNSREKRVMNRVLPLSNYANTERHTAEVELELRDTLRLLRAEGRKVVLSFSGGADSTLLALMCREEKLDFTLIFLRAVPAYAENFRDMMRANSVAHQIDMPVRFVDVPLALDSELAERIEEHMLFDRHVSLLHFSGMREVVRLFGTECIVMNGQGADSVLSFGPTQNTRGDFVARLLSTYPFSPVSSIASRLVANRSGKSLRRSDTISELHRAFFDQEYYYSMVRADDGLAEYIDSRIGNEIQRDGHLLSQLMQLKIFGFLQGSDNQVVIQSALAAGIERVVMPYVSPALVASTIQHKNRFRDLIEPKYPVKRLLAKRNFAEHRASRQELSFPLTSAALEEASFALLTDARNALLNSNRTSGVS